MAAETAMADGWVESFRRASDVAPRKFTSRTWMESG